MSEWVEYTGTEPGWPGIWPQCGDRGRATAPLDVGADELVRVEWLLRLGLGYRIVWTRRANVRRLT